MEKIQLISLKKEIQNECPLVLIQFKEEILILLEDYIYMPFFYGVDRYMIDNFNKRINKDSIKSKTILDNLERFNNIFYDIYKGNKSFDFDIN